jgi:hypothetical protein
MPGRFGRSGIFQDLRAVPDILLAFLTPFRGWNILAGDGSF